MQTGDLITYRVTFGCNSTTANCGAMDIRTIFPAELIPVDVQVTVAQGYTGQILYDTPVVGQSTVVGNANLLAGRSSEALITVRVSQDAAPGPLAGVIFNGNIPGETEPPIQMGDLVIEQQQEMWGITKSMSIGNRVWNDDGVGTPSNRDNGVQNAGELCIAGVRVELYRDTNGNGRPDAGEIVGHDVTDAAGFYLFDRVTPGIYLVYIPPVNFLSAGVLANFDNSNPTGTETVGVSDPAVIDQDDNGIYENFPETNGVVSGPIIMERDNEPEGEADLSAEAGTGPGFDPTEGDSPAIWDVLTSRMTTSISPSTSASCSLRSASATASGLISITTASLTQTMTLTL